MARRHVDANGMQQCTTKLACMRLEAPRILPLFCTPAAVTLYCGQASEEAAVAR